MSFELRSTSSARPRPIRCGRRAIGPPPAITRPPTSHCESTAFSRLTNVMSHASAISLPLPVARPRIDASTRPAQCEANEDVRPRLEAGRALRDALQVLEVGVEVAMIQEEAIDGALEDHDLHLLIGFDRRHDGPELTDKLRAH